MYVSRLKGMREMKMKHPWIKGIIVSVVLVLGLGIFPVQLPFLHMTHATPVAKAAAPKYVTTANVHLRKGPGNKIFSDIDHSKREKDSLS